MSANGVFIQALADATQRPIELSPVIEATTLGAAFLAGMAVGIWSGEDDVARAWSPRAVIDPRRRLDRQRWYAARNRALAWVPELSALEF
jgi:glycerol kinase